MNAIIWKKYINITSNKKKLIIFLIFPIIYLVLLWIIKVDTNVIFSFFPLTYTVCSNFFHWNVEDLVYSEVLLNSTISVKKFWRLNYLFISITGYIYSYFVLAIGYITLKLLNIHITIIPESIIYSLLFFFVAMAIIAVASLQYTDFSKFKQYATIPFSILPLVLPVLLVMYPVYFRISTWEALGLFIGALIILSISEIIVACTKNETLLKNIYKLTSAYTANIVND